MMPPITTSTSSSPFSFSSSISRGQMCMCAPDRIDRPIDVGVLLQRRGDDLLGRLAQAGVDHLHAGVAQRARDHLRAAVVAVEARLGDDDSDFAHQIRQLPAASSQLSLVVPRSAI